MYVREPYYGDIAKLFAIEVRGKSAAHNRKGVNMWRQRTRRNGPTRVDIERTD